MYAPLQQSWAQEAVLLSGEGERHLKALMLFLLVFGLLGWTHAVMTVGLFYVCYSSSVSQISISASRVCGYYCGEIIEGVPTPLGRGVWWLSFRVSNRNMTIWRWQLTASSWRKLCAISSAWNHQSSSSIASY